MLGSAPSPPSFFAGCDLAGLDADAALRLTLTLINNKSTLVAATGAESSDTILPFTIATRPRLKLVARR